FHSQTTPNSNTTIHGGRGFDINTYVTRNPGFDPVATGLCTYRVSVLGAIDGGFELEIKIDDGPCNSCQVSGGMCGLNTTRGGFSCFRHDQDNAMQLHANQLQLSHQLCLCQPYSICKEAISCGGIGDISYPFWGVNRPNFCGQPGFELRCLDDVPVINMSNISYRILEMNSSSPRTIKVARQDYWKTLCPSSFANTSINFSLFNYSSGLTNVTFYYGCDVDVPRVYYSSQVCNVNNGSDQVDTGLCKVNVTVPVFSTAAIGIEVNPTTLQDAIDGGFKLEIKIDNDQCNSCEGSGGRCGHNTTTGGFTCHCQDQASATICNSTSTEPSGMLCMPLTSYSEMISMDHFSLHTHPSLFLEDRDCE
ncbi:hypothetical protein DVH24_008478, partial [Malus domestica]